MGETEPPAVGGLAVDLDGEQAGLLLETGQSSDSNALLAGVIAALTAAGVVLGGAVWYAWRRWVA